MDEVSQLHNDAVHHTEHVFRVPGTERDHNHRKELPHDCFLFRQNRRPFSAVIRTQGEANNGVAKKLILPKPIVPLRAEPLHGPKVPLDGSI